MARTGRPRKPAQLHALAGNTKKHPERQAWVETDARFPSLPMEIQCPPQLTLDQAQIWWRVMAAVPRGLLRRTDPDLVARFCVLQDTFHKLNQKWHEEGEQALVTGRGGMLAVNPIPSGLAKISTAILRIESELGFTPASRSRVDFSGTMKVGHQVETAGEPGTGEDEFFS
jgi:P27 family predicted phage terminase small subunit